MASSVADVPDNPDFAAIAQAAGLFGVRVEKAGELDDALRAAFEHNGPALVDVRTDRNELSLPPRLAYGEIGPGSPQDPDFETVGSFPLTVNDPATTDRVAAAFATHLATTPSKSTGRPSARTSATFPMPQVCPIRTGAWGSPMRRPTAPPRRPDASRTSPPTTPRNSCPRCSPPCEQAPRPWSLRRWPGSSLDND